MVNDTMGSSALTTRNKQNKRKIYNTPKHQRLKSHLKQEFLKLVVMPRRALMRKSSASLIGKCVTHQTSLSKYCPEMLSRTLTINDEIRIIIKLEFGIAGIGSCAADYAVVVRCHGDPTYSSFRSPFFIHCLSMERENLRRLKIGKLAN